MSTSDKLTYLNETKNKLKEAINLTNANITNDTFRSYEYKLKKGIINTLNNPKAVWDNFEKVESAETAGSIILDPTEYAPMQVNLKGNTYQHSTTGKNLLPISPFNNGYSLYTLTGDVVTQNNTTSASWSWGWARTFFRTTLPAGTYTLIMFANTKSTDASAEFRVYKNDDTMLADSGNRQKDETGSVTFTLNEETQIGIVAKMYNGAWKFMLISGGTPNYNYEPYTNGASPNPDYPQDIHIVSGDNTIKVENKNLLDNSSIIANTNCSVSNKIITSSTLSKWDNFTCKISDTPLEPNVDYYVTTQIKLISGTMAVNYIGALYNGSVTTSRTMVTNPNLTNEYQTYCCKIKTNEEGFIGKQFFFQCSTSNNGVISVKDIILSKEPNDSYVEHQEYTKEINLGEIEVGGIGEYEDEFFKNTIDSEYYDSTLELDKWYLKKRIGKFNMTDISSQFSNMTGYQSNFNATNGIMSLRMGKAKFPQYNILDDGTNRFSNCYCEKFTAQSGGWNTIASLYHFSNVDGLIIWLIYSDIGLSEWTTEQVSGIATGLNTYFGDTNFYLPLATPENTLLNDTLQETLDSFYSYQEQTNISQENNDLPFVIKASAIKEIA